MRKRFNDTGLCVPNRHYMVENRQYLKKIKELIDLGEYFAINRPRQYGKTTTIARLETSKLLESYHIISLGFEGVGDTEFSSEAIFCPFFLQLLSEEYTVKKLGLSELFLNSISEVNSFKTLSNALTEILKKLDKRVVLIIDEVDKSSNNQLFIHFLGMLRDKYLLQIRGRDTTFHSVILAGLHDVKNLKLKLRPDEQAPWNIAADFNLDMTFHPKDIESMLQQYIDENNATTEIEYIAEDIYFYTNGYPYFVSKLCKIIDEEIKSSTWCKNDVIHAVKILLNTEDNTNFDTVIKNLESSKELFTLTEKILIGGEDILYDPSAKIINLGRIHGIFRKNRDGKLSIFNKIYEEKISNYMISTRSIENSTFNTVQSIYLKPDGRLDIKLILTKFQEVIEEKYSNNSLMKSSKFLENELRMQFLVFLKPIINGTGFSYKEAQTSAEKRLDIIILFKDEKFIIELKIWYGEKYHIDGIKQIKDYIRREHLNSAYMIIMSKNRDKKFTITDENGIFTIWL